MQTSTDSGFYILWIHRDIYPAW